MIGNDPNIAHVMSFSKDGIIATTYADDYITRGDCYNGVTRHTIASGATLKMVLDFTGVSADKGIFILPLQMASSGGYFKVDTYRITTYTGGTDKILINANSNSIKTCQTVFKYGITSTDTAGADKREYIIGGGTNPASLRGGAGVGANALILNNQIKICAEITNTSNASADFSIASVLYEII